MTGGKLKPNESPCRCPYCDSATQAALPICQACGAAIVRCQQCGRVLAVGQQVCPSCGGKAAEDSSERRQPR